MNSTVIVESHVKLKTINPMDLLSQQKKNRRREKMKKKKQPTIKGCGSHPKRSKHMECETVQIPDHSTPLSNENKIKINQRA
jgi:hypothetical protein